MRSMRLSEHACEGTPEFQEGIECVLYIRCMEHRAASQLNTAESNGSECGECVRQQCWKDMLGLIARTIEDTPIGMDGKDALAALEESLLVEGVGTFGMSDELEKANEGQAERSRG